MIVQNCQLDLSQICSDLHIEPNLRNLKSCALGNTLVEGIISDVDPAVYYVPLTAESTEKCRVILHENAYGRSHALTACSCEDWQIHHCDGIYINLMSSLWICPHGASVLLSLGRSNTYLDFVSVPKALSIPTIEMFLNPDPSGLLGPVSATRSEALSGDLGIDRRRFFAAFGKAHRFKWGCLGIDKEMAMEAYRLRFNVLSLSKLKQSEWAIAAAEVQAATRSNMIMINRAANIKETLLSTKEAA